MFQEKQKILTTDGKPFTEGVIEKVSTWGEVHNLGIKDSSLCYLISSVKWPRNLWKSKGNLQVAV